MEKLKSGVAMRIFEVECRRVIVAACAVGSVPWVITCVYVPFTGGPAIADKTAWALIFMLFRVFGPIYFIFENLFEHYFFVVGSHMNWPVHYWRWSVFTVVNIGFWIFVFGLFAFVINLLKRKVFLRPKE